MDRAERPRLGLIPLSALNPSQPRRLLLPVDAVGGSPCDVISTILEATGWAVESCLLTATRETC